MFLLLASHLAAAQAQSSLHPLTINIAGSGTVTRNPSFQQYPDGAVVTLTANPSDGWLFSHWTGDLTGSSNPANIEMNAAKSVTAYFILTPSYKLNVTTSGQGNVFLDPPGGTYSSNSVINVSASAIRGWVFTGWSGDASGTANPISIRMDNHKTIGASFAQRPVIDVPPTNVIAALHEDVSFSVAAHGSGPLSYAWQFGNTPLTGATNNTLTITNLQLTHEGTYTVTVSSPYGSATASAILQIVGSCSGTNVVTEASEAALRSAIATGGHVRFCINGTISLTQPITVTKDVSLDARNREVTISGNNATRLFIVSTNINFAATNLTFANGNYTAPNEPATGVAGEGGAIYNGGGKLLFSSCRFTNNHVAGGQAAQSTGASGGPGLGGAIFNRGGQLVLIDTLLSQNSARGGLPNYSLPGTGGGPGEAFGGAIASIGGSVQLVDSMIVSNACYAMPHCEKAGSSGSHGGALHLEATLTTIVNSSLIANEAVAEILDILGCGARAAQGGAINAVSGELTILDSELSFNKAAGAGTRLAASEGRGGAIFSSAKLTVRGSTFASNQALAGDDSRGRGDGLGGGLYSLGEGEITGSTFHSNLARGSDVTSSSGFRFTDGPGGRGLGGAIFNASSLTITNCTIAQNSAKGGDSKDNEDIPGDAVGGGIFNNSGGSLSAVNTTIASNLALGGTSGEFPARTLGANVANTNNATLALRNSILAYPGTNSNAHGTIIDAGHNISSDGSANFSSGTSFNFTDPRLEPLANYGGPTLTMALRSNSPAIDFGDSEGAPATDQRGFPRGTGSGVDIGAFEFQPTDSRPSLSLNAVNGLVQLQFQAAPNTRYLLQSADSSFQWTTLEEFTPSTSESLILRTYTPTESQRFFRLVIP